MYQLNRESAGRRTKSIDQGSFSGGLKPPALVQVVGPRLSGFLDQLLTPFHSQSLPVAPFAQDLNQEILCKPFPLQKISLFEMLKVHFTQLYTELFLPCFRIAQNNRLLHSLIPRSKMQTGCFAHLQPKTGIQDLKPSLQRLCARKCLSFLLAWVKLT